MDLKELETGIEQACKTGKILKEMIFHLKDKQVVCRQES